MNFNIYNSLILLGAIQGLIFGGIVLFSKKYQHRSIYYLIGLILAATYNNLQYYLSDIGIMSMETIWSSFYLPMASLAPPLIYFFVVTFLNPTKKITKGELLLYFPFVFFFIATVIYKTSLLLGIENAIWYSFFGVLNDLHELSSILFLAVVIVASLRKINQHKKSKHPSSWFAQKERLDWLTATLFFILIIDVLYAYLMIKLISSDHFISFYALWIANSALVYWLGHIGVYKYGVKEERKQIRTFVKDRQPYSIVEKIENEHIVNFKGILHDKKRFLDPQLTLKTVANELNLSKSHVSRMINAEMSSSFTDYVNSLRVEEAKTYLLHPEFSNYTLVAIGLEAGFNSKTTFNSAFKKHTGMTPSQFKKNHSN